MTEYVKEPWHLDKRIPLAIIMGFVLQTGALFYWGGKMEQRVTTLESRSMQCEEKHLANENEMSSLAESAVEIKTHLQYMRIHISDIKKSLEHHSREDKQDK